MRRQLPTCAALQHEVWRLQWRGQTQQQQRRRRGSYWTRQDQLATDCWMEVGRTYCDRVDNMEPRLDSSLSISRKDNCAAAGHLFLIKRLEPKSYLESLMAVESCKKQRHGGKVRWRWCKELCALFPVVFEEVTRAMKRIARIENMMQLQTKEVTGFTTNRKKQYAPAARMHQVTSTKYLVLEGVICLRRR